MEGRPDFDEMGFKLHVIASLDYFAYNILLEWCGMGVALFSHCHLMINVTFPRSRKRGFLNKQKIDIHFATNEIYK